MPKEKPSLAPPLVGSIAVVVLLLLIAYLGDDHGAPPTMPALANALVEPPIDSAQTRSEWREEQDLLAQRAVANWAAAAFFVSLAMSALTLVSIYFVIRTFQASQEQAKAAQKQVLIAQKEFRLADRPYLTFQVLQHNLALTYDSPLGHGPSEITLAIINVGKSPALLTNLDIELKSGAIHVSDVQRFNSSSAGTVIAPIISGASHQAKRQFMAPRSLVITNEEVHKSAYLIVRAQYRDLREHSWDAGAVLVWEKGLVSNDFVMSRYPGFVFDRETPLPPST